MKSDWEYDEDPWGIIPIGWYCEYSKSTVTGFCCPCGKTITKTRVLIRYDGGSGGSTTGLYLVYLKRYLNSIDINNMLDLAKQ